MYLGCIEIHNRMTMDCRRSLGAPAQWGTFRVPRTIRKQLDRGRRLELGSSKRSVDPSPSASMNSAHAIVIAALLGHGLAHLPEDRARPRIEVEDGAHGLAAAPARVSPLLLPPQIAGRTSPMFRSMVGAFRWRARASGEMSAAVRPLPTP